MKKIDNREKILPFLYGESSELFDGIKLEQVIDHVKDLKQYHSRENYLGRLYERSHFLEKGISTKRYILVEERTQVVKSIEFLLKYNLNTFQFKSDPFIEILEEITHTLIRDFGTPQSVRIEKNEVIAYPEGINPKEKIYYWENATDLLSVENYWSQDPEDCFFDEHILKISYTSKK